MDVINRHGAPCCGIAPGARGKVDEGNLGVKAALAGRLLVPAEDATAPGPTGEPGDLRAQFDAAWAEREARFAEVSQETGARIASLESENAALKLDLEAATAPAKPAAPGDTPEPIEPAPKKSRATREG